MIESKICVQGLLILGVKKVYSKCLECSGLLNNKDGLAMTISNTYFTGNRMTFEKWGRAEKKLEQ